jgi:hypothetical protein
MTNFGALTDHFGILAIVSGGGTLADVLELVDSSKTPVAKSRADALDEYGDIAASTWFGNPDDDFYEASSTFAVVSDSFDLSVLDLGELTGNKIITSIEITTSNSAWPQLTVTGMLGVEAICGTPVYSLPSLTITGCKYSQELGFTTGDGARLTGSTVSASIDMAQQDDGGGDPVAHGLSGGVMTGTAQFVRVTAAPSWTVTLSGATETQAPSLAEPQAEYHTAEASYEYILSRDA